VRLDQNEAENVVQNASPEKSPQAQTKRGKGKANSKDDEVAAA
jgi:hypothetical protein